MRRWLVLFFLILIPLGSYAANTSFEQEESQIPKQPSTPPPINQLIPTEHPHCERFFVYRGKKMECDSNVGRDADRLRPLMQDVPSAIAELDAYQENREKIKLAAYFGT